MAPSCLLYYLGINKKVEGLLHHNLFFDTDFKKHAQEIYSSPQWPSDPLFYACVPSKTDSLVAPEGHENIFLLIPVAPGMPDTPEIREKYLHLLIDRLEAKTGESIRQHIVTQKSFAYQDFVSQYHSFKGNAYGLANTLRQTAFLKPKMQSKKVKNLFYAGQLTVPGPGVPPALISGEVAANQVEKYFSK
jgi:phytoene desaturase